MTIGSRSARSGSGGAELPKKLLSLLMAMVLAFSLVPSAAWAADAASEPSAPAGVAGQDEALEEEPAAVPTEEPAGAALQDVTTPAEGDEPSFADGQVLEAKHLPLTSADEPKSEDGVASSPAPVSAPVPDDDSYVFIQATQDQDGTGKVTGALEVGTVLWANLHDYDSDDAIPREDGWAYQWMAGPSASSSAAAYEPIAGQTAQKLEITEELAEELAGSYLVVKVTADGRDYYGPGYSGISTYNVPGPVMRPGAVQLSGVELAKPASLEVGTVLEAKAYTGSSYAPTYVDEGVAYAWKYAETASPSYGTQWTPIEGATGSTFTVTDEYQGACISVSANAGANTVDFGYPYGYGPFKQAGAVDIYSAVLLNGTATTNAFAVGDTVAVQAKEKGASAPIDPDKLTYQWLASDDGASFEEIPGATQASLQLDAGYEGKQVKCRLAAKVGGSTYLTRATGKIAAAGSVNVTSVRLDKSGKLAVGDTLNATASAASGDVTDDPRVAWSWYRGGSAYATDEKIEGATGSSLVVTDELVGSYLEARADGGYGEKDSSAAGPVVKAGSVELYKVEATGDPRVGSTLSAKAYESAYAQVPGSAIVDYQWQYAETRTTSDSAFKDIPGATGVTYTIGETIDGAPATGRYVRVKATSDGTVVSTKQPSYYGSTYVDPLGPIMLEGAYELSSVKLASSGQGMQAGNTITPTAQVKEGYYESAAPADAKVAYAWEVRDGEGGAFEPLKEGVAPDGALTLSPALVGKQVRVSANALVEGNNPRSAACTVLAAGEYDLLRVTLSPASGDLFTGDEITARVQARSLASATYGDDVSDDVTYAWSAGESPEGPFVPIEGADSKSLSIPASAAGRYLKVTATSGTSSVEAFTSGAVVASDSLEGAAKKLEKAGFRANPVYGQDENMNDVVESALADLGFADVSVTTKSAEPRRTDEHATVGVSTAAGDGNGRITYFFMDPDSASSPYLSYTQLRQFDFTFTLSRDGETYEYAPGYPGAIPWDDGKVAELLGQKASTLAVKFASGDSAASVTRNLTLPCKLSDGSGAKKSWSGVSWASSDPLVVAVAGSALSDRTGKVTRTAADRTVLLTAAVSAGGISSSGGPETTIEKTFEVTVKGDPDKVAAERAALEQKVGENFTCDSITLAETGEPVGASALTGDVSLPKPATIGVDGKYYEVKYTASTDAVMPNGWAGKVYRPLPGEAPAQVDITLTVTDKANAEISASKTLSFTVSPMDQADLDREAALMEQAVAGYAAALANGQDAGAVTGDLHAFQKAYLDEDGNLAWAYDHESADAAGSGIVPVDLEGYDPLGSAGWRLFKSSNPSVVSHENLLVTQPAYNAKVTVESRLSSEKYARYAERYPDDPVFQKLAGRTVAAEFTVEGTSGQEDPYVTATCSVIGMDKDGAAQTWAAAEPYTLDAGATVADLAEALFARTGMTADFGIGACGWSLNSITSPFDAGLTLKWGTFQGLGWMFYVNGQDLGKGAGECVLQPGDRVIWRYGAWDDPAPTDKLSVTCEVIGADADGAPQTWASATSFALDEGATAADLSEALFEQAGLSAQTGMGQYGWFLDSIASPYTGEQLGSVETSPGVWSYWQLFVNGELAKVGAGGHVLEAGDEVVWCYGSDGTLPGQVAASCEIVGLDANGNAQRWAAPATYTMVEGATAADLTEQVFAAQRIEADYDPNGTHGWFLDSVTSPFDPSLTLAMESVPPYRYWQLFVNGKPTDYGAGSIVLQPGDEVSWFYSEYGASLPDLDAVVTDPDAPRPSYDAAWPGFGGDGAVEAPTPTQSAEQAWSYDFREGASGDVGVSEPLIVNGDVYLVVNGELRVIDASTGTVKKNRDGRELRANVGGRSAYCNRPVYTGGVVVVPSDDGSLAAFTADELVCVWKTKPLEADGAQGYQSLSSLTVNGSYVFAAFTTVGAGSVGTGGVRLCVDVRDGSVRWLQRDEPAEQGGAAGYYWAGAAVSGADLVVGNDAGLVQLVDGETGAVKATVDVGAPIRAGVVALPETARAGAGDRFAVVSSDGVLHLVAREGDQLAEAGSVRFAGKSTSTPAVSGGKAFVCGADDQGYGTLSVVDLASLSVERTVRGGKGEAQSSPLVSVQGDGTYAYFTCNGLPGGVYGYRLGDEAAYTLFTPAAGEQNYCFASVVADGAGNLYYTNDAGRLFALKGLDGVRVTFDAKGGSFVPSVFVALGKPVLRPSDPVRSGYTFAGWFSDEACTAAWDFATPVGSALTLYAKWEKQSGQQEGSTDGETSSGVAPGQRTPLGGAPAAAHAPLVQEAAAKAEEKADAGAAKASTRAGASSAAGGFAADDGPSTPGVPGGVNPWVVGGIAVGAAGLAGAVAYAVLGRRRVSASAPQGKGRS